MKKMLLTLLAAFALPTAVNAETWWLVVGARYRNFGQPVQTDMVTIPTNTEQECKLAGEKLLQDGGINGIIYEKVNYSCLKGK